MADTKMSDEEASDFLRGLDDAVNQLFITSEEEAAAAKKHCTLEQIRRYWLAEIDRLKRARESHE